MLKLRLAKILYFLARLLYRSDTQTVVRNGIKYELDLSEGIDLAMFLFGSFQKHVSQNKYLPLQADAVIFDVGANFGIMTLQFAKAAPLGKVYAFEPTSYAFSKLQKNLSLNQQLAERIVAVRCFVSSNNTEQPNIDKVYASWKVTSQSRAARHKIHGGIETPVGSVQSVTLDSFCMQNQINRLDLIKIDTDGHEYEVLEGARQTIGKFRPAVIFEIGLYLMEEAGIDFGHFLDFFDSMKYRLCDSKTGTGITAANHSRFIPVSSTIDILALPSCPEKSDDTIKKNL